MRSYFLTAIIFFSANAAQAQSYPQYQQHPQQEASVNYPTQPAYPQPAYVAPTPAPTPIAPSAYYDARPTDAGQSVVTDVRQMNF